MFRGCTAGLTGSRHFEGKHVSNLMPHLQAMLDTPSSTLALISIMCGAAMYFIRAHLVVPALVFVLGPVVVVLSVVANYILVSLEYFPLNKADQWLICTIFSATVGIIAGLGIAALLSRMMDKSEAKQSRFHRA